MFFTLRLPLLGCEAGDVGAGGVAAFLFGGRIDDTGDVAAGGQHEARLAAQRLG